MKVFVASVALLSWLNTMVLRAGRAVGVVAIAAMVIAILIQVFFRYVLNSALPWPDEAARFCMLWMTGLMAPTAFRRGGFVAIDMLSQFMPRPVVAILSMVLLLISLLVLVVALRIGYAEVTGFGGRFATASLYLPTSLDFSTWYRIPRSWMMLSLLVGVFLLVSVNIELIGRSLLRLFGRGDALPVIAHDASVGAE